MTHIRQRSWWRAAAAVVIAFISTVGGHTQREWTVADLGSLGGLDSQATDVNARGQIVGAAILPDGTEHAILWENGLMTDLGTLGGSSSFALAINNRGQVVGYSVTASGELHASLWEAGVMKDGSTLRPLASTNADRS